jgi:hypothetical protein
MANFIPSAGTFNQEDLGTVRQGLLGALLITESVAVALVAGRFVMAFARGSVGRWAVTETGQKVILANTIGDVPIATLPIAELIELSPGKAIIGLGSSLVTVAYYVLFGAAQLNTIESPLGSPPSIPHEALGPQETSHELGEFFLELTSDNGTNRVLVMNLSKVDP